MSVFLVVERTEGGEARKREGNSPSLLVGNTPSPIKPPPPWPPPSWRDLQLGHPLHDLSLLPPQRGQRGCVCCCCGGHLTLRGCRSLGPSAGRRTVAGGLRVCCGCVWKRSWGGGRCRGEKQRNTRPLLSPHTRSFENSVCVLF
jgi:hypothetical protein